MCSALPASKTCCQCEQIRPASSFLPSALSDDGLTDRCKPCVFANAARDRAERELRRHSSSTSTQSRVPASAAIRRLSNDERTTP